MHQSSIERMKAFKARFLDPIGAQHLRILDIGSQDVNGSYQPVFAGTGWQYVGADMAAGPNVDVVLEKPYRWAKLEDESFDVVISGQAFEHIEYFWVTMLEIARILKPGGFCCIVAPSAGFEHRYPVDCWRFYRDGFTALARWARLECLESTTDWESKGFPNDGSGDWKDSWLIARKTPYGRLASLKRRLKYRLALAALDRMVPPAGA